MNLSKYRRIVFTLAVGGLVTLVMIFLATRPGRSAGPWYVAPGGDDGNDCLSPGTPCASINGALAKPDFASGDIILVAAGTYTGTGAEVVLLDKDVTLSGGWAAGFTTESGMSTVDGENARRGITVESGVTAVVERFIVQNGHQGGSTGIGGGICNTGGTLTMNNSAVSGSAARHGGGIWSGGSWSGGSWIEGTLTLNNSTVSGNTAGTTWQSGSGGGISMNGTLTLNNSIVEGNSASSGGGGINGGDTVALNNSTVKGNTASVGGGVRNYSDGVLTLNNGTVSGNTAWHGGGLYNEATMTLQNGTVSDNTSEAGGGIYNDSGTTTLRNTILAGNMGDSGPDCSGAVGSSGYNLIGDTSGCTFTPMSGDITNTDPLLGPLQDNGGPTETHALLPGSPAIDAGDDSTCPATDQRGVGRPLDGDGDGAAVCDIGAYELEPPIVIVPIDIKPGSDPNSINCNNENSVIAVAILTTEAFDATTVDHTTVTFEGASETHVDKKSGEPRRHEEDADYDGDLDLVFHFHLGDTDLGCDSTEGVLTGETFDGQALQGTDSVRMVDNDDGACPTSLYISPTVSTVGISDTVTVDVMVSNVMDLHGVEFYLTFDPSIVQVEDAIPGGDVNIIPGDFLEPGAAVFRNYVNNSTGEIEYVQVRQGAVPGVDGSGVLARITFHGLSDGVSDIAFTWSIFADAMSVPIEHITQDGQVEVLSQVGRVSGRCPGWCYIAGYLALFSL